MTVLMRIRGGGTRPLALDDWHAAATPSEREILGGLDGPVLDLGCGPGRLVVALAELGVPALGVDASPSAVRWATATGAPVLQRSVFERLPAEGRWAAVLLFDGNVGIGGDPVGLLARVRGLLAPDGVAVVEVDPPGSATHVREVRLERGGERTPWFPWAWVGADGVGDVAATAGLALSGWEVADTRWFALLRRSL